MGRMKNEAEMEKRVGQRLIGSGLEKREESGNVISIMDSIMDSIMNSL
jgi:hypothetical protein